MRRFVVASALVLGVVIIGACGPDYELVGSAEADGGADASEEAAVAAPIDADVVDATPEAEAAVDAQADADATVEAGSPFAEVDCEKRAPIDGEGVFVRGDVGVDKGCLGPNKPCKTITAAIAVATQVGRHAVYVGPGTYDETPTLPGGMVLEGAWNVTTLPWTPDCTTGQPGTAVIMPSTANVSVRVTGTGKSLIRFMAIQSKATAASGESLYGIMVSGGVALSIEDSVVYAASGGDGLAGSPGTPAAMTPASCASNDGLSPTGTTNSGAAAPVGMIVASGYAFGGSAGVGATGLSGDNGTAAPTTTPVAYQSCAVAPAGACSTSTMSERPLPGSNGCGGAGGGGGAPGQNGGSAIGIFASASTVELNRVDVSVGSGGDGGAGGPGAAAAKGSAGAPGATSTVHVAPSSGCVAPACDNPVVQTFPGGPAGGAGGNGLAGGQGGGGAGGWSVAVLAYGQGASFTSNAGVTFGSQGFGSGGDPNGPNGVGALSYP